MTELETPNHECPFCHRELAFYEVERTKTLIKYSCAYCNCKRKRKIEGKDIKPEQDNYFHIFQPYYGAWTEYGWAKNDWGIGLHKDRIDALAAKGMIVWVSFGKDDQTKYSIGSQMVQTFPVRPVQGKNVDLYIVPRSKLRKMES